MWRAVWRTLVISFLLVLIGTPAWLAVAVSAALVVGLAIHEGSSRPPS